MKTATIEGLVERVKSGVVTKTTRGSKVLEGLSMEGNAEAHVEVGLTKNLGNYESLRVTVGVRLPSTESELPKRIEEAQKLAASYMYKFIEEAVK